MFSRDLLANQQFKNTGMNRFRSGGKGSWNKPIKTFIVNLVLNPGIYRFRNRLSKIQLNKVCKCFNL